MHRSITLSEIVSSTFSTNVDEVEQLSEKRKFAAKFGIGVIEFLVCSLYQCYGILLAKYIQIGTYTLQKLIWTTMIYLAAWHITAPFSQCLIKCMEERKQFHSKIVITISALLLAVGIVTPPHYLCYGIFGGIFSNIIYSHLKHIARKKLKTTEKAFEGNILSARAISLLIMPHIILLLVANFSMDKASIIYSAIILNIIPAVLIIKLPKEDLTNVSFNETNRYQTLPAFSQQIKEMKVFSTSGNTSDMHSINKTNDNESNEDDTDDESENEEDVDDDLLVHEENMQHKENIPDETSLAPTALTSNAVQIYYSQAGVSILPEIPEEEEDIEDSKNINVINTKRLSRISMALEELNNKERKESLKELVIPKEVFIKPEQIRNIEYIPNYTDRKRFIKDLKFTRKEAFCSCSPYTLFVWKRRMRSWKDCLIDTLCIPICKSLCDLHFYPTLWSKISINISSVLFISLTPYVTLLKNEGYKSEDMAFLLSYTAFSWCLSLILLPLLVTFTAVKLRMTFIVGLVLSSCSMLLLTKRKMTNDFIIWSSLLFGFGYGLTRFTENFVYKAFAGKRKYVQFERTLDVLSGVFVILIYYFVYINNVDVVGWFPIISSITYAVNAIIWIVVPVAKEALIFLRKYFRKTSDSSTIL